MKKLLIIVLLLNVLSAFSQNIGINEDGSSPNSSAILDVKSADKGLLIPRVQLDDVSTAAPITAPVEGLLIYNETGTEPKGFYYWNGTSWIKLTTGSTTGPWERSAPNVFLEELGDSVGIGTETPNAKLHIVSGSDNTPLIIQADANQSNNKPLIKLYDGAGNDLMWINSDHETNVFMGNNAGSSNAASATLAPYNNPPYDGLFNVFIGKDAGQDNVSGWSTTGVGYQSLSQNTTGQRN
jgi:hypothetical protein